MIYRGWDYERKDFHGRECWVATRHGVSMNANSIDGILSMIDQKAREERALRNHITKSKETVQISGGELWDLLGQPEWSEQDEVMDRDKKCT